MYYSLTWSGGKDSTASIILAHEYNEPVDEIVFCEVMYDLKRGISGENPSHIKFVKEVAKPLFESWGYKVVILRSDRDYLDFFHRVIEKPKKHIEHKGKKFGFPLFGMCGVKRDLKMKPIEKHYKNMQGPIIQYVGICADEGKRIVSLHKTNDKISLLEKYGYTQDMAYEICKEHGLLSPSYELSKRGGCWFCPNAKFEEHKDIKRLYPEAWNEFVELENEENVANRIYNPFGLSLKEIDENIYWDSMQIDFFKAGYIESEHLEKG